MHVHLGCFLSLAHIILRYFKINGNSVSPAHFKVRSYSLKKLLHDNTVGDFITRVVWLFLKYVFITCVSECFQASVRVKSSPVLFKSNLKGLALQVFGKRAGIVVNFLSLYILKITAYLLMNCFVAPSRCGSRGAHTWSTVINSAKAHCGFRSASPAATGSSQPARALSLSWSWPGSKGRQDKFLFGAQQGTAGTSVQEKDSRDSRPGVFGVFFVFFVFIDHQRMAL